jgi:hypothetical protein
MNKCVYVDDLIIRDDRELATLCLLYDHISLPHPYDHDPSCERVMPKFRSLILNGLDYQWLVGHFSV